MTKKYTARELNLIIKDILCNAFEHMEALIKELKKLEQEDPEKTNPGIQTRIRIMNATMTVLNDVIHPAHAIAYKYFKGYENMLDLYVKGQKIAFENKLVPECFNHCCDADGKRSYTKAQELAAKEAEKKEVNA